jgi:MOSC domain-containing protein YiiM
MKVVSVNIAKVQDVIWRGKKVQTGIYKNPVDYPVLLGEIDVEGDHVVDRVYHGGLDKACYIYSADCYSFWREKYPSIKMDYGMFGENITIEGLDETFLNIGDKYRLGEAVVQISQPRQPCFKLGIKFSDQRIIKEFIHAPFPGAYLRVLEEGEVRTTDTFELLEAHTDKIKLLDVFRLLYTSNPTDKEIISELLGMKIIPIECLAGLKKRIQLL